MSTYRRRLMMSQGKDIATLIKDSMVLWYDIARQGCTNETMKQNPVLRDLSGNGHDARCYNFAWSGMSGVGGYVTNYTDYYLNTKRGSIVATSTKIIIEKVVVAEALIETIKNIGEIPSYRIRVSGIPEGVTLRYGYYQEEGIKSQFDITEDGEYILPANINSYKYVGFKIVSFTGDCNITIEQIPLYPNALISDGVDDYCLVSNLPTITKDNGFTVVSKREVTPGDEVLTAFASKQTDASEAVGAFTIERGGTDAILGYRMQVNSFGLNNEITSGNKSGIMYCTSTDYNDETSLIKGDHIDSNILVLFKLDGSSDASYCGKYALYSFLLFNRDLTQTEINWVKTNLIEGDYKFE